MPVGIASAPGDDRLFVLERTTGLIRVVDDGRLREEPFLDVHSRLEANGTGEETGLGERGLLGLAFHPSYADNGRFFVYYADFSGLSELVEYHVSDDPTAPMRAPWWSCASSAPPTTTTAGRSPSLPTAPSGSPSATAGTSRARRA